jgi:hypothetical protein
MVDIAKKTEGWIDTVPLKWKVVSIIAIFVLAALIYCLAIWTKWYPDDNPIEQAVEEVIKDETGIDVDLSPTKTPEQTPAAS